MIDVSVIIPTYNRVQTLPRAIESVLIQNRPNLQLIVVDDGSTDQTEKWITHHHPDIQYIKQKNNGVSHARNTGIRQAKGEFIALLDSDDAWQENKLHLQLQLMKKSQSPLCHTDEIWIRHGKRVNAMKKHQKHDGHVFSQCLPLCWISPSSVLLRRSIISEIGYFDESLPACEDYDMWCRICAKYPIELIPAPLTIKYGGHVDQLSKKYWGMDRFRIKSLCKLLEKTPLNAQQTQQVKETLLTKIQILQNGAKKRNNLSLIKQLEDTIANYIPNMTARH